jgi:glycosyltransferase involved in cell wall biosynthesis
VYTDSIYRRIGGAVYGEFSFTLFQAALRARMRSVTIMGRLDPHPGPAHYRLPDGVGFVGLPHYASLARPGAVLASLARSLRICWRALDDVDVAWVFGPYPHAVALVLLALARRRGVALGVRQDFPAYVRSRRPGRRWMHLAADLLELCWRVLARFVPVLVVGPELLCSYGHAPQVQAITVSLITEDDVAAGERAAARSYDGAPTLLSVGRLDEEKNPLLLADVLAHLRRAGRAWRLVVCGEGPLEQALAQRLRELGVSEAATLRGHVPLHEGLLELYRQSHAFLHVSRTEGFPQVLLEAFASGVPVVATAVGGVPAGVGDAALLVAPDDARSAAVALARLLTEPALRARLIRAGLERARAHTLEREVERAAAFLQEACGR